jgi:dTDP-4-dehydrorhamnose 3,5-epimerase
MNIQDCSIPGLKLIHLDVFEDRRGMFCERFHEEKFAAAGLPAKFVQDNHSRSLPGVLRGVHFQHTPAMGKLVSVIRGRIWDVVVDVRPGSPTFGKHFGVELNDRAQVLFWVPAGFAHGFCVLGDEPADLVYKLDVHYNAAGEEGIRYNDPDLAIDWPIKKPILSDRDKALMSWKEFVSKPPQWRLS